MLELAAVRDAEGGVDDGRDIAGFARSVSAGPEDLPDLHLQG